MENDVKYVFDMNAIVNFIFDQGENMEESEIVDTYGSDDENNLILAQRQIREGKTSDMTSKNTIKYDFIKMFIEYVINSDYSDPSFGETIMFNTMLNEGLLKKID